MLNYTSLTTKMECKEIGKLLQNMHTFGFDVLVLQSYCEFIYGMTNIHSGIGEIT